MNLTIFILYFILNTSIAIGRECLGRNGMQQEKELCGLRFEQNHTGIEVSLNDRTAEFDIRTDTLSRECVTNTLPRTCAEATKCTRRSGIYKILLTNYSFEPFLVRCNSEIDNGGWIVIQRREDGSVDFFRNWRDYRKGFGNIKGEFFIGLDKLHALTNTEVPPELLIFLNINNELKYAHYSNFTVGDESESYKLKELGNYTGNAGDSLRESVGEEFTTEDHSHYVSLGKEYEENRAKAFESAWWFSETHNSDLNGKYKKTWRSNGIVWSLYKGYDVSIKQVTMMIRPNSV